MSNLIPFSFEGAAVRVIARGGEPWFVLADVCRVLAIANPGNVAARLDDDEKHTLHSVDGIADPRVQALVQVCNAACAADPRFADPYRKHPVRARKPRKSAVSTG